MIAPTKVRIDTEVTAAYVAYREVAPGESIRNQRLSDEVIVDYNANGDILGLELLGFDDAALDIARNFAAAHGMEFPADAFSSAARPSA